MNDKLRAYIESLFEDAPKNKKTIELKEEMLQNLIEKYNDLLAEGKSEEAAYNIAAASIGDISDLIDQLNKDIKTDPSETEKQRKKSALLVSISVMLFIVSATPIFIFHNNRLALVLMFIIWATATGLLIYNGMTKPKYNKLDDTLVEEFKEWKVSSAQNNSVFKAIGSALWLLAVVVYFILSFFTGAWYITWVVFLITAAINSIIKAVFELKKK